MKPWLSEMAMKTNQTSVERRAFSCGHDDFCEVSKCDVYFSRGNIFTKAISLPLQCEFIRTTDGLMWARASTSAFEQTSPMWAALKNYDCMARS